MNKTEVEPKKALGLLQGCSMIIGIIIGSGIFITPKNILENTSRWPGLSLIVWLISGGIAFVGAICYTELGTLIQRGGGNYTYIKECYGGLLAFLYVWVMIFVTLPSYSAISALTVSKYLIKPFFQDCDSPLLSDKFIAIIVLSTLGLINSMNLKLIGRLQLAFTLSKVITLLFIICAGFILFVKSSIKFDDTIKEWFTSDKPLKMEKIVVSIYNCLFAYSGWNCLNFLIDELKEPTKNLPRAVYISIPACILIYFVTTVAYFLILSPNEILKSETIAITFSAKVLHRSLSWLTPFLISFSTFGCTSTALLSNSRIYYAAANDRNLPKIFGMVNITTMTPVVTVFFMISLSIIMVLMNSLDGLILTATFTEFLFIGITISCIPWLRYKRPDAVRSIKVFIGFPIFFLFICAFMIGLTVYGQPQKTLYGLIFLLLGIPVYYFTVINKTKPKILSNSTRRVNIICQKLFLCAKK